MQCDYISWLVINSICFTTIFNDRSKHCITLSGSKTQYFNCIFIRKALPLVTTTNKGMNFVCLFIYQSFNQSSNQSICISYLMFIENLGAFEGDSRYGAKEDVKG